MGWKNVKDHYRIGHHVTVTEQGICIGSAYIHDIIVIRPDGVLKKRYDDRSNEDLIRYQSEIDSDPDMLQQLIQAHDTFTSSVVVYTYDGGDIIEKQCEVLGWPNVTHDGDMMYENAYSDDKELVLQWAKQNSASGIASVRERIKETEDRLCDLRDRLQNYEDNLAKLEAHT